MKLSIIIVHFNTPQLLYGLLESIYKYVKAIDFEVIVIDNNSIKNPVPQKLKSYKHLIYIENRVNYGFAKANNQAVEKASGEWLFFLNSDTYFTQDCMQELVSYAKANQKIGILAPALINVNNTIQEYGSVLGRKMFRADMPIKTSFLSGAAMLMKRDLFLKAGGFDSNYFFYNEDLDLCTTITRLGYDLVYYPKARIVHLGGKSTIKSWRLQKQALRSSFYFLFKHYVKPFFTRLTKKN